ncbi:MAG: hypothetical protein SPI77_01610 [Corynebacterium sp.]|nr:hypothetical protein [Corynebacterium sp.]
MKRLVYAGTLAGILTATVSPLAGAYSVDISPENQQIPLCIISSDSEADSGLSRMIEVNQRLYDEVRHGLRTLLPNQQKNFSTLDTLATKQTTTPEDQVAYQSVIGEITQAAQAAEMTYSEFTAATMYPIELDGLPVLQADAQPILSYQDGTIGDALTTSNFWTMLLSMGFQQQDFSEAGVEVMNQVFTNYQARMEAVTADGNFTALDKALQACNNGTSTSDPAIDPTTVTRLPHTGGIAPATGGVVALIGIVIALLLAYAGTKGQSKNV